MHFAGSWAIELIGEVRIIRLRFWWMALSNSISGTGTSSCGRGDSAQRTTTSPCSMSKPAPWFAGDLAFRTHHTRARRQHSWLANRYRRAQRYLCATYVPGHGSGDDLAGRSCRRTPLPEKLAADVRGLVAAASRYGRGDTAAASERSHWELSTTYARNATAAFSELNGNSSFTALC